jgi:predicted nuclease of predicted toxin-antitoxin system
MRLVLDMNLSPRWVEFLTTRGIEALHWSEVGDPRAPDATVMAWARDNERVLFTHDLDFCALLAMTRAVGPSVIQLRTQDVLPESVGDRVALALLVNEELLNKGAIVTIDDANARVRVLPIERGA